MIEDQNLFLLIDNIFKLYDKDKSSMFAIYLETLNKQ